MFRAIYYIYDSYVYRGIIGEIHENGFSKEHALGVFSFLQLCNLISVLILLQIRWYVELHIFFQFSLAMLIYVINRWLFIDKEYIEKPSLLMIIAAFTYAVASVLILCLSFIIGEPS